LKIYGYVERGYGKKECEDRVLIGDTILAGGYMEKEVDDDINVLIAVADGVGGNHGGACASAMAVEGIRILNRKESLVVPDIKNVIEQINRNIIQVSLQNTSYLNMATTLSGIAMNQQATILFHIGNSRVYTFSSPYLKRKTTDHTTISTLLQSGAITQEEAQCSPIRNELDACLGGGDTRYASKLVVELQDRIGSSSETILLCSDGVHDYIPLERLEELLADNKPAKDVCENIAHVARECGSKDDISIIIFDRNNQYII
jgi:protein phosphatase